MCPYGMAKWLSLLLPLPFFLPFPFLCFGAGWGRGSLGSWNSGCLCLSGGSCSCAGSHGSGLGLGFNQSGSMLLNAGIWQALIQALNSLRANKYSPPSLSSIFFFLFALINQKRVVHPRVYIGGAFPCLNVSISSSFNFIFSNLQSPLMAGDGGGGGEWRRALEKAVRPRLARTELKL